MILLKTEITQPPKLNSALQHQQTLIRDTGRASKRIRISHRIGYSYSLGSAHCVQRDRCLVYIESQSADPNPF